MIDGQFMNITISLLRSECNSQSDPIRNHNCVMENETFGSRLKQARSDAELTQAQLAKMSGVSQTTISDGERGRNAGSGDVARIAAVLGVNALWLADGKGQKAPPHPPTAPGPAITGRHQKLIALFEALTPERQDQLIRDLQNAQQADEEAAERLSADRLEMILKRKKSRRAVETSQFAPTAPIAANPDIPALESP